MTTPGFKMPVDSVFPIPNVKTVGALWCAYEHHTQSDGVTPPKIIYVNACRLTEIFRFKDAIENSEWFKMYGNGGAIMLRVFMITDDRNEAIRHAIERAKSFDPMPRCNLFGWNMNRAARPLLCSNGMTYQSQTEAAQALNINQANISKHLRGGLRSVGGYTFAYATGEPGS